VGFHVLYIVGNIRDKVPTGSFCEYLKIIIEQSYLKENKMNLTYHNQESTEILLPHNVLQLLALDRSHRREPVWPGHGGVAYHNEDTAWHDHP